MYKMNNSILITNIFRFDSNKNLGKIIKSSSYRNYPSKNCRYLHTNKTNITIPTKTNKKYI